MLTTTFKKYYSKQKEYIKTLLDIENKLNYRFKDNIVQITDGNNNTLEGNFQVLGVFNETLNTWYWSWACPFISSSDHEKLLPIKQYSDKMIKDKKIDHAEHEKYDFYCTKDVFFATKDNLQELIAMSMYLTKSVWVFSFSVKVDKIKFRKYIILTSVNKI